MKSGDRTVVIYRDILLAYSETFIAAQAGALERWTPLFAGTRHRRGVDLPLDRVEVLRGALAAARFKLLRSVPGAWLNAIRLRQPRLVHAHFGPDGFWATPLARALDVPLVVTFHGYDATAGATAGPLHTAYLLLRPQVFKSAARVIAVSRFIAAKLLDQGCPEEKLIVHHIGIDTARFTPSESVPREPIVLFVGRLVEKKGCEFLLRAMAMVRSSRPQVRLVVIGDGPLRARLEAEAGAVRNVAFAGALPSDEVRRWMERASVLCLPSVTARTGETEGLPIVLLEAQSMGLPVVATRHAGAVDAVRDGETGLLVQERDVPALAAAISRLLDDGEQWRRIAGAGRDHVRSHFDLRTQTALLEDLYDEVASRSQTANRSMARSMSSEIRR